MFLLVKPGHFSFQVAVIRNRTYHEVGISIIRFVPVDMMYDLIAFELSPQCFLGYKAMFKHTILIIPTRSIGHLITHTKSSPTPPLVVFFSRMGFAHLGPRFVAGMTSSRRGTHFGPGRQSMFAAFSHFTIFKPNWITRYSGMRFMAFCSQ